MRSDSNAAEIIKALRVAGASVNVVDPQGRRDLAGFPDAVVGWQGRTFLLEIKCGKGQPNANQVKWHANWKGEKPTVVWCVEDALRAIGVL